MSLTTHVSRTVASQATPTSNEGPVPYPFHPAAFSPLKSLVSFRSQDTTASHSSFSSLLLFFPAHCLSGSPKLKALLHPSLSRQAIPSVPSAFTHSWERQGNAPQNNGLGEELQTPPSLRFWWQRHPQRIWQSKRGCPSQSQPPESGTLPWEAEQRKAQTFPKERNSNGQHPYEKKIVNQLHQ